MDCKVQNIWHFGRFLLSLLELGNNDASCCYLPLFFSFDLNVSVFPFYRKTFPRRIVYSIVAIVFGAVVAARYGLLFMHMHFSWSL